VTRVVAGAVAVLAVVGACKSPAPTAETEQAAQNPSAPSEANTPPADHLAPDELVEGTVQVFGVTLPRVIAVKGMFVDVAYAGGPASVHALARYFRPRLTGGTLREGPLTAVFEHVKVPGKPGIELSVHIASAADGSTIALRDSTPRPAPALPDEASRWRQVGLTPQGRLADPTHLD
jgi:hypothetical protein